MLFRSRPEFLEAFERLADVATKAGAQDGARFRVHAPLLELTKAGIVTLATELAREIGVPMKMTALTHAEMTEALNRGWGHLDSRSFLMLQKERAGVEIKVPAEAIKAVLDRDG